MDDTRGQANVIGWIITQLPFWFLVTLIILVCVVGLRQAGLTSLAHLVARRAGSADLATGQQVAQEHGAVWGVSGAAAQLTVDPQRRSVVVHWGTALESRSLAARILGRVIQLEVTQVERQEAFYGGPPEGWE